MHQTQLKSLRFRIPNDAFKAKIIEENIMSQTFITLSCQMKKQATKEHYTRMFEYAAVYSHPSAQKDCRV